MKYFYCPVLILISLSNVKAQHTESIPVQFGQFFNAYSLINPASCGSKGDVELEMGRQGHVGWKNISTSYASGSLRIKSYKKRNNFQVLGLSFVRDREGEFLKRSKAYVTYGWHTRLTRQLSIGAGASAGLFSYLVSGSNASVAGSDQAPDGSIGLWLYHQRYYFGASANQVFNSKLTPLQETARLMPHYNVTGGYSFKVSRAFSVNPKTVVRYTPGYDVNLDVAAVGVVDEVISAGANYMYNKGLVCLLGLEKLKVKKGRFRCMFSYAIPVGSIASNMQKYELTLNYDHKPDQKKKTR
jgi:type IX secretion system PorP/SprF family membrane protein